MCRQAHASLGTDRPTDSRALACAACVGRLEPRSGVGVEALASQTNYITRAGFQALQSELDWLWKQERPKVTEAVATAAALGDRSENADYIYGKKRLREIDRRIRFLTKRIDELQVVDAGPRQDPDRVYFGAFVTIEDETGEEARYQLVGPDEFDASKGRISVDSPVGRALIGRHLDDEVSIRRPKGETLYTILAIDYEPAEGAGQGASKAVATAPDEESA